MTFALASLVATPWLGAAAALFSLQSDSQAIARRLHRAPADFEATRRWNLPRAYADSRCDERIGRFCYWNGDDGERPPEEPTRIGRARAELVAALDGAAALLPGDGWIAGQRVRYLVESGELGEAAAATRACRGAAWWCAALAGLVSHVAGDFAAAETSFATALRDMPAEERCRWTDLSPLLEGELAKRYRSLGCAERTALEARVWWLAQPLLSLPANDRRTEHFARVTMARLMRDGRTAYALGWGDDLGEVVVRYGWPVWWTAEQPAAGSLAEPAVTGHERTPSFHFFPAARAALDPAAARTDDWAPAAPLARERYAPVYAQVFAVLDHQVAVLRRGDTALVVAAYDLAADTSFAGDSLEAALILAHDEQSAPVIQRLSGAPARGVLSAATTWGPLVFSLEVTALERRRAARARCGLHPPDGAGARIAVSDLLLFDPPDSLRPSLSDVMPRLLGAAVVRRDRRLGLYWEIYGLDGADERVMTSLAVVPVNGWVRRAAATLGLAGRKQPLRLEWEEIPARAGGAGAESFSARALTLDLSGLSPGRYRIALAVGPAGEPAATAAREIRVAGPSRK